MAKICQQARLVIQTVLLSTHIILTVLIFHCLIPQLKGNKPIT